jgi:hypothetical protein
MTAAAPPMTFRERGEAQSRLRGLGVLFALAVALLVLVLAGLLAAALQRPHARPLCSFGEPCQPPAGTVRTSRGTVWKSGLGLSLEYGADVWSPVATSKDDVTFRGDGGFLYVITRKSSDYRGLYDQSVGVLKRKFALAPSDDPARTVLGPNVGYEPGVGADYCGSGTSTQGGTIPVDTVAMAASRGGISAFVALVTPDCAKTDNYKHSPLGAQDLTDADRLLDTVQWPSGTG